MEDCDRNQKKIETPQMLIIPLNIINYSKYMIFKLYNFDHYLIGF